MSFDLTDEEGIFAVKLSRRAIAEHLKNEMKISPPKDAPKKMETKCGVFVTLSKKVGTSKELRGCIGYPEPIMPLVKAIIDSAINAAFSDPRFSPLSNEELTKTIVEVSVLTPLQLIKVNDPNDYSKQIKIGADGLVVERGWNRGLLLPQVPVEWKWDADEFLVQCCMKAGLPPDAWLTPETKVYKFQAIIFEEESPNGAIKKVRV
ncbi:MAG: TIGR00296 family protein [Candidatus Bathyarchaeota archaeon]